jgi:hypothetical protein
VVNYLNSVNIGKNVWGDIRDGNDLWERFCNLGPPKQNSKKRNTDLDKYAPHPTKNQRGAALRDEQLRRSEASNVKRQNAMPTATGYPTPEILHSEAMIGGYFLSGNGYDDVAVLSIPTFMPKDDNATSEFQDTVGVFLKRASSAGKKKLIIDLRGNGGGRVFLGYDLFKQLFPSIEPYGATRFRANEAFNLAGQAMTEALANYTYEDALQYYKENGAKGLASQWKSIFNYRLPLSVTKENYTSWEEYFGPHEFNNDNFTTPSQWDLLNFFSDDFNMDVTGYRTRAGDLDTTQHFKADNIVLLQDGSCGSTCAVFSEMAKTQGHIQQVVVGGKPETGPMQGVAGTKGAQVWTISAVHEEAATALEALKDKTDQINNTDPYNTAWAGRPLMRTNYDDNGAATSRINLRDNIRANDTDEIPLEFTYEAADCRFFYTAAMVRDPVEVWKRAADARWGDVEKVCVEGSTGHPSSLSGAFAVGNNSTNTPNSTSTPNSKTGTGIRMGVDARLLTIIMVVFGVVAIF